MKSGTKKTKWGAWEMRWENCRRKKKNPRGQGVLREE